MTVDATAYARRTPRRRAAGIGAALSLVLTATLMSTTPASAAEMPPNPIDKPGWVLDRNDEFNGGLDSSLWIDKYLESRTTTDRAQARYGFRNNALVLRIDDDQPTYYPGNPMKVSSLQTGQMTGLHKTTPQDHTIPTIWNYTPTYGYFEIRAKTSARSGLHAAFWAIGTQDSPDENGEIDIVEDPGPNSNQFLFNVHRWSDQNISDSYNTITTGFNITNEMHIYGLEWTPTQLKLYVDNTLVKTLNTSPDYRMAFLLSIYENAGWTGTVDPSDTRPKEFVIDYFRAYKKAPVTDTTYKIRSATTGLYLDSGADGEVTLERPSAYDDQLWTLNEQQPGYWTLRNVRTGRAFLDTDPGGKVIWNTGWVGDDSLWAIQPGTGGYRLDNKTSGRAYLSRSGSGVTWNTGATDASTLWVLERQ